MGLGMRYYELFKNLAFATSNVINKIPIIQKRRKCVINCNDIHF